MNTRCAGSLLGLAVGDALGYPHEFRTVQQVRREIDPEGITGFLRLMDPRFTRPFILGTDHPPGTFTDDTQMSICVAEALVSHGAAVASDPDDAVAYDALLAEMARRFARWFESEGPSLFAGEDVERASHHNDRSPGETTGTACQRLHDGVAWRDSGVVASKGCGANMRVAPIGLFFDDLDVVQRVARDCASITHGHHAGLQGAAAAALLVAMARMGLGFAAMHAEVLARCAGKSPDFEVVWRRIPEVLHKSADVVLVELSPARPFALGEGWVAEEAVASAMWCAWRHPDDYSAGVLAAVNTDGDSDSIATIAGSILGARLGLQAVPRHWVRDVEDSALLLDLAQRLSSARLR